MPTIRCLIGGFTISKIDLDKIIEDISFTVQKKDQKEILRAILDGIKSARRVFYGGYPEKANSFLKEVLEKIGQIENSESIYKNELARLHYEIGKIYSHLGKNEIAEEHFSIILDVPKENFLQRLIGWFDKTFSKSSTEYAEIVVDILNASALAYRRQRRKDSIKMCEQLTKKALKQARNIDYKKGEAEGLISLAMLQFYKGDINNLMEIIDQSLEILQTFDEPNYRLLGKAYNVKLIGYFNREQYPDALECCEKAKQAFENGEIILDLPDTIRNRAEIRKSLGNYAGAKEDFEGVLKEYNNIISDSGLVITYLSLGTLYYEMGDIQKSLNNFEKVLKLREKPNQGRALALSCIARVYHWQGKMLKATELFKEAIQIYENLPYKAEGRFSTYFNYFKLLIDRYTLEEESKQFLEEAENVLTQMKSKINPKNVSLVVEGLIAEALLEKARGNLFNASTSLEEAEKLAFEKTKDKKLLNHIPLYIAEVALERYKIIKKQQYFDEAIKNIKKAEEIAENAGLSLILIDIKRIKAELAISVFDWENATNYLQEALKIIKKKEVTTFKEEIEGRLLYIKVAKETVDEKPATINVNEALSSIRFAQGLPTKEQTEKIIIESNEIALIAYILDSKMGPQQQAKIIPKKYYQELQNFDQLLIQQGTVTMMMLGQGDTYTHGLYIIPCPKIFGNRDKIVFGTTIKNPKDPDLRGKEAAYCIIEILFPKIYNNYFTHNKEQLREIFDDKFEKIQNVDQLTRELLEEIKSQIISHIE
ncbi:MAG: tetratricopeptide repeat protein [Candidatus Heimdallarchaeota archaeon]|nr:tetratricopeptide repeat protein [Candidatus Heimdallarchaeota archaeon]